MGMILLSTSGVFAHHKYGYHEHRKGPSLTVLHVDHVIDSNEFICDLAKVRPIFGQDIKIRIRGIRDDVSRKTFKRIRRRLLNNNNSIELRNLRRCRDFSLLCDVYVNDKKLKLPIVKRHHGNNHHH